MDAREFFEAAREAQRSIESRFESIELMRSREEVRAQRYDKIGGHTSGVSDSTRATDARMDAERAAMKELAELYDMVEDARTVCRGVRAANPQHRMWGEVLEKRYCDDLPWHAVATKVGLSERATFIEHRAALEWVDSVGIAAARNGMGQAQLI